MILDFRVQERLRDGGVVHFAVAVAPVSDQVDHHVAAKRGTIFERDLSHAHDRVRIFSVHMKNGHGLALGQGRGEARGLIFARLGGEPQQIIYDHVDRAADRIRPDVGKIQRLRPNALPGKGRVPVQNDRKNFLHSAGISGARLLGARAAHDHGIDRFEVARIRSQVNAELAPFARAVFPRRADVILDVAAAQHAARVHILEARENIRRALSRDVRHHVQPPAMAHAQHHLLRARRRSRREHLVEQRNHGGHAFERKSLAPQITRLKHLLEKLRANQPFEDKAAIGLRRIALQPLGNPAAALGIINVHEFGANRPAVEFSRRRGGFPVDDQFRMNDWRQEAERIEIRRKISPAPVAFKHALVLGAFLHDRFRHFRGFPCFLCKNAPDDSANELGSHILSNMREVRPIRQKSGGG